MELLQGADRARCEVCDRETDALAHLYIRAIQGLCAEHQVTQLVFTYLHIPSVFTGEIYHVGYSSNTFSTELDGLLAGGRGLTNKTHVSTLHPFTKKCNGPDENSATPQFASISEHVFATIQQLCSALRLLRAWAKTFLSDAKLDKSSFWNLDSRMMFRKETLDGQLFQKTPSISNE